MSIAEYLNRLSVDDCHSALAKCCAAARWVDGMLGRLPFESDEAVMAAAAEIWWSLEAEIWLEAFAAHPMIGDVDSLRQKYSAARAWATGEQEGAVGASDETLQALAAGNAEYQRRFGYLFIVFATGKSAEEMLARLQGRLDNSDDDELKIAAAEQLKITQLRLRKLAE